MSFLIQEKINYSAHSHWESWLPLSGPRRRLLLHWMGHNLTCEQSQIFGVFLTWISGLMYAWSHFSTGPPPEPTKSWFLVLMLVVWGGRVINSNELRFSDISYYCKQLVPSWDHSCTVAPTVQTYQEDHHSPSTGQHRELRKSVC